MIRNVHLALTAKDFETLVSGGEIIEKVRPTSGLATERRINEIFDFHIILSDIGFNKMQLLLDKAREHANR